MWICNGALRYYRAKQQTQTSGIKYQVWFFENYSESLLLNLGLFFLGSGNGKSSIRRQDLQSISIVSCSAAALFWTSMILLRYFWDVIAFL
jgi:hypothetical protein